MSIKNTFRIFLTAIVVFAFSCKEPDVVGLDVLPEGEQLGVVYNDTLEIQAFTVREDSVRTDQSNSNLIGSYVDPFFGPTSASIYTQFTLPANDVDFGDQLQLDSVVFSMRYGSYYGKIKKLGGPQTFKVYRITEDLLDTVSYYSHATFQYDQTELGSLTFRPAPSDSVTVFGQDEAPQIRIKLDDSFGEELLNSTSLSTEDVFKEEFKGLYITPDNPGQGTGQGAILNVNLRSTTSAVTLYYSNSEEDSLEFDFVIDDDAVRVGHFEHDYSMSPDITAQLNNSTLGMQRFFVQAMAGLKAKIKFPDLTSIEDSGKVNINRAQLIMHVDGSVDNTYFPPAPNLTLARIKNDGSIEFVRDFFEGSDFLGGNLNSSNQYVFNIPFYIQDLLDEAYPDNGLYLLNSGSAVNAYRTVIEGTDTTNSHPMKLVLTYTKLD